MSENKKYYFLKFKEDYFNKDDVKVIEAMENGHLYSLIILKLYLKSLKYEGQLKINNSIPYTKDKINLLAGVINHDPDHLTKAINVAMDLNIVEILDSGELFMSDIQDFIGQSSNEGDRKKKYRERIKSIGNKQLEDNGQMSGQTADNRPPEIELNKEIDNRKEKKDNINLIMELKNLFPYKIVQSIIEGNYETEYLNNKIESYLKADKAGLIDKTKYPESKYLYLMITRGWTSSEPKDNKKKVNSNEKYNVIEQKTDELIKNLESDKKNAQEEDIDPEIDSLFSKFLVNNK